MKSPSEKQMEATTISIHREVSATDTGEKENQDLNTHKVVSGSGHREVTRHR